MSRPLLPALGELPPPPDGYAYIVTARAVILVRASVLEVTTERDYHDYCDGSRGRSRYRLEPERWIRFEGYVEDSVERITEPEVLRAEFVVEDAPALEEGARRLNAAPPRRLPPKR